MNRKPIWLLALTLIVVGGALYGVKWRRDHPTPTWEDEMIRQRLLGAKAVYIYRAATPGKDDLIYYVLSPADRKEVTRQLFLIRSTAAYNNYSPGSFELCWGTFKTAPERIYINRKSRFNTYENSGSMALSRLVHPVTRAHLQQWVSQQPNIQQQLAKNEVSW